MSQTELRKFQHNLNSNKKKNSIYLQCSKYVNFPLLKSGGGEGSEKLDNNERLVSHLVTYWNDGADGATRNICE